MKNNLLILLLLLAFTTRAQTKRQTNSKIKGEQIEWANNKPLTWDNFQAKPIKNHFAWAFSDVAFGYEIEQKNNQVFVIARTKFNCKYSWVKEDKKSEYLLKHEQTHFDIIELYARKFREELLSKSIKASKFSTIVQKLYDKYVDEIFKRQQLYDKETNLGMIKEKQEEWNKKVAEELKELESYSNPVVEVKNINPHYSLTE